MRRASRIAESFGAASSARKLYRRNYEVTAMAAYIQREEKRQEFAAQHGPVRHLVSEGKPVGE